MEAVWYPEMLRSTSRAMKTVGVASIRNKFFHSEALPRSLSVIFTAYPSALEELVDTASCGVPLFCAGTTAAPPADVAGCELGLLCPGSTAALLAGCVLSMFCCPCPTPAPHAVSRPIKPITAAICFVIFVCPFEFLQASKARHIPTSRLRPFRRDLLENQPLRARVSIRSRLFSGLPALLWILDSWSRRHSSKRQSIQGDTPAGCVQGFQY